MKHVKHVKYVQPAEKYIKYLPDYLTFGRKTTLRINPKHIPDLHWQSMDTYHATNIVSLHTSCVHPKCGCEHSELCWEKKI